jgi:hypothetical protein
MKSQATSAIPLQARGAIASQRLDLVLLGLLMVWLGAQAVGLVHRYQHGAASLPLSPGLALVAGANGSGAVEVSSGALTGPELRADRTAFGHEQGLLCALFDKLFVADAAEIPPVAASVRLLLSDGPSVVASHSWMQPAPQRCARDPPAAA